MEKEFRHPKIVMDPLWGIIDITDVLPLIDTPQFQALGFKYQLGVTSLVFPSATHTRKQHSFGAYHRARVLADRWYHKYFINKEEAKLISAFALLHDIGHGPFSHVIEDVAKERWGHDNDTYGSKLIEAMREPIEGAGLSFSEFKKIFNHENPLYLAVHDKNLGAEKLDYLSRDAFYTIGEVPGVEYLALYTYFIDGELVIDERAIDQAKAIQDFYVKMYKNVYLRKNSIIGQRLIQKMAEELIRTEDITEKTFLGLTDFGLLGLFETAKSALVQKYYKYFMERQIPRTAIALRPEHFAGVERAGGKAMTVFGISSGSIEKIARSPHLSLPSKVRAIERDIAGIADVPEESILVVPPLNVERFVPKDIKIYSPGGKPSWLSEHFKDHFRSLSEEGKSYVVLRVCVLPEFREKLSESTVAKKIKDYILESV